MNEAPLDRGWVPKSARWPEITTDVAVGQMRAFEFDAVAGDWAIRGDGHRQGAVTASR
ncbi:MAG: hypothetical protein ABI574_06050 [Burkholderiales bacterium]